MESSLLSPCSREPKRVGNFLDPQIAARGGDDIEQDLEALGRELRRQLLEAIAADHEEAAHGIGDLDPQRAPGDFGGERAGAGALPVETVGTAALDVAAADHEVDSRRPAAAPASSAAGSRHAAGRRRSRRRKARWRRGCPSMQAPDRPRRPIAPDAAHPAILPREASHHVPGAIGRIVIDKDDLPGGTRRARSPAGEIAW